MYATSILLAALVTLSPVTAIPTQLGPSKKSASTTKALYFLDNNPSGASVISLAINPNGTLSNPVRTSTNGDGLLGLVTNGTAAVDSLFAQDAIIVSGTHLLTINPGSATLSLFSISPSSPTSPVLVGTPASTRGSFPVSVAYAPALHLACALNGGVLAGVACFRVDHSAGLVPVGDLIPMASSQGVTPPTGPLQTVSDIVFNPSQTALFVTVKGNGSAADPGYVYAYPVDRASAAPVADKVVVSRPAGLLADFGMSFLGGDDRAVVADPVYGASLVNVAPDLSVTVTKKVAVAGQKATCWTAFSARFDAAFLLDAGNPNITALDPATGDVKYTITGATGSRGSFDSMVSGEFLYVLQGSSGVSVFSLQGSVGNNKVPELVQSLDLTAFGSRQGWQGLAVFE